MEAKLEVRVTNCLNLPGSVLALALKVPHPGKTFGSRANQMVDQSSWHTILSIPEESTFPYLENIFHLVNLCQPLTSLRGSLAVIVRQRERFWKPEPLQFSPHFTYMISGTFSVPFVFTSMHILVVHNSALQSNFGFLFSKQIAFYWVYRCYIDFQTYDLFSVILSYHSPFT